jgi:ACS family hexuronate transporter-like MFS transporter
VFAFQLAYAIGLLLAGPIMDRIGARRGFIVAITVWSLAAILHAEATVIGGPTAQSSRRSASPTRSPSPASSARGSCSASARPATSRGNQSRRGVVSEAGARLATGLFNSGTNIGALLTPLIVPWITLRGAGMGLHRHGRDRLPVAVLLGPPLPRTREPPWPRCQELAYIRSDPPEPAVRVPWRSVLPMRQTWAFMVGKFLTDPIWWLYLFWIPDFLNRKHGIDCG